MNELLCVVLGGVLAIAGGAFQSWISIKGAKDNERREKREEAYLGYIEALLKLKVSDTTGMIKTEDFWNSFRVIQAKLKMYGSEKIIAQAAEFDEHLYECWECGNMDVGDTEKIRQELIKSIRQELNID